MNRTIKYLHVHIPKCGGNTVNHVLTKNFGRRFYAYYGLYDRYQFNSTEVHEILKGYPQFNVIASHLFSLDLPFAIQDELDIKAICFVREPVDRALSFYFYTRNHTLLHPDAQKLNPLEFFALHCQEKKNERYCNGQFNFLTKHIKNPTLTLISNLIKENKLYIFPANQMVEAMILLERLFPQDFKNCAFPYNFNVSTKDKAISPTVTQLIEVANPIDRELYQISVDSITHLIHDYFPNRKDFLNAVSEFRDRCSSENNKQRRYKLLKAISGKFRGALNQLQA